MSKQVNPHTPTPGKGLIALSAEAAKVEAMLMEAAMANGGEFDAALDAYLDEVKAKIAEKPDQYKYVMDRLEAAAELLFEQATEFDKAGLMMESTAAQMTVRIKDAMQIMGVDHVKGKSWQFKLAKAAHKLVIHDPETLKKVAPAFVDVTISVSLGVPIVSEEERVALDKLCEAIRGYPFVKGVEVQHKIDNARVKAALEAGEVVAGAQLEGGKSLRSSIVKADS